MSEWLEDMLFVWKESHMSTEEMHEWLKLPKMQQIQQLGNAAKEVENARALLEKWRRKGAIQPKEQERCALAAAGQLIEAYVSSPCHACMALAHVFHTV
jgi:hypothetical protein